MESTTQINNYSHTFLVLLENTSKSHKLGGVSREVLKSVLLMTLFIMTLISSLLPFALQRAALRSRSNRRRQIFVVVFSHLSCFGGGVFLATCLLDLLPDSREVLQQGFAIYHLPRSDFPMAEFLMAFGFFMVLFSEQIFLWCKEYGAIKKQSASPSDEAEESRSLLHDEERSSSMSTSDRVRHKSQQHQPPPPVVGYLGSIQNQPTVVEGSAYIRRTVSTGPATRSRSYGSGGGFLEESVEVPTPESASGADPQSATIPQDVHFDPESHSTSRAVLLLAALSLHATFEGLALGLQQDASTAVQIFGALAIHKCILAFSLGLRLVQSKLSTLGVASCCLIFSLTSCIGGFIGVAIIEEVKSSAALFVNGALQGLACGTFLYVTAFEILPHELNDGHHRLSKLIMLTMGFSTICLFLLLWPV